MANRNVLYAEILVDELARAGLREVCAAPGSRHTPLMLAFARHPQITVYSHLDERSASFFALGLALAAERPVALICTSGTAGANMYPAVIEAHHSHVPLIVLTADRPPEMQHSGANQTMNQINLFGEFALWFVQAAPPEADPPAVALRNLRTLAARAYATANGIRKGVVHVNIPFRKPLEPTPVPTDRTAPMPAAAARADRAPFTRIYPRPVVVSADGAADLAAIIAHEPNGLIVCGPHSEVSFEAVYELSRLSGYPIAADTLSGLRFHPGAADGILGGYENYLQPEAAPWSDIRVVIRTGQLPLGTTLNDLFARADLTAYVQVSASGEYTDDTHRTTHLIQADAEWLCGAVSEQLRAGGVDRSGALASHPAWELERRAWRVIGEQMAQLPDFDGALAHRLLRALPEGASLLIGNSLPIRLIDQFGQPMDKRVYAYGNRGVSGIDGNISAALGVGAAQAGHALAALVGDITFYHDMNGLLAVKRCGIPITLVVLNNDGGGIFHRLPIREHEPEFTEYFITPHGLTFKEAAGLYGLEYLAPASHAEALAAISASLTERRSLLIEVSTDARDDLVRRAALMQALG